MGKRKIVNKLFAITSLSLVALLSIQLLFQSLYLEKFYIKSKKTSITQSLEVLGKKLESMEIKAINKELLLYSQEQGVTTGIVNLYGNPLYGFNVRTAFIEIKGKDDINYKVSLSSFIGEESTDKRLKDGLEDGGLLEEGLLEEGKRIKIRGYEQVAENEIYPQEIEVDEQIFRPILEMKVAKIVQIQPSTKSMPLKAIKVEEATPLESVIVAEEVKPSSKEIEGIITEVYLPGEEAFGSGYRENKILEQTRVFIEEAKEKAIPLALGKTIIYESADNFVGINHLMGILPMLLEGELVFLTSMTSLQQVEEASDIMNSYTLITFSIALGIAILLAYYYARKITKPLIALKNVTSAITNLDFTQKCSIESEDEIGELAQNIDAMSKKLKDTLETLQEDMRLKERLDNQRKQFIVDVSHELKTPLTVLKATCEGFVEEVYDTSEKEYFHNMLSQINAMSELIQELLEVARLDNERSLKLEIFDLSDSFLKMHRQLKYLAKEKKLTIKMALEECFVKGDRKKIEVVIRNIYNNAIFYTMEGESIEIKTYRKGDKCFCSIENYGTSIPKEELKKIWEAFYRIEGSRNKSLGGSGLGLYIVSQILNKHDAKYQIENTEKGVKVWFALNVEIEKDC